MKSQGMHYIHSAPPSKNAVSAIQISSKLFSLTLEDSWTISRQCPFITKDSIYHISHMYIQPLTTVVYWPKIGRLMEVSTMFYICRYCVFTWDGSTCLLHSIPLPSPPPGNRKSSTYQNEIQNHILTDP